MVTVDVHVHPLVREIFERESELPSCVRRVFGFGVDPQPLETLLGEMDSSGIDRAVLLALDCRTSHNCFIPSNESVAELVERYPERFTGFASVDPRAEGAADTLRDAVSSLGLKGVKLNPILQGFAPNEKLAYPIYETAQKLGVPVLFHAGMTWTTVGRMELGNPLLLDAVASDFPKLKIIIAHFGFPWVWETFALSVRHPNVYVDIANTHTGTPLEHLKLVLTEMLPPRILERFLMDRVLFGSDYPRMEPWKIVSAIEKLPFSTQLKKKILGGNAAKLLGV